MDRIEIYLAVNKNKIMTLSGRWMIKNQYVKHSKLDLERQTMFSLTHNLTLKLQMYIYWGVQVMSLAKGL